MREMEPALLEAASKHCCEISLFDYMDEMWDSIESHKFVANWHHGLICEHLQALADGQIENLLINVPPGCSKSLTMCVFFPTWYWLKDSASRWFFASYHQHLATRDSVKCRKLIESPKYQAWWGDRVSFSPDQNQKTYYETTAGGYRLATSIGGHATGEHMDFIVCMPHDELVWTIDGPLLIGEVVENRTLVDVLAYDTAQGRYAFKPVVEWIENPGADIVEVELSDGTTLRCTQDHKVWTSNRGWVAAGLLTSSDVLPRVSVDNAIDSFFMDAETRSDGDLRSAGGDLFANSDYLGSSQFVCGLPVEMATGRCVAAQCFCDMIPGATIPDSIHRGYGDGILYGQVGCGVGRNEDSCNLFGRQFRFLVDAYHNRSMLFGVVDVVLSSSIGKVLQSVVCWVAVQVANLATVWTRAYKYQHQTSVNEESFVFRVSTGIESQVSSFAGCERQRLSAKAKQVVSSQDCSVDTANRPAFGDFIIRESGDSVPRRVVAVRHAGYSERTYCLTVADYHTMCCGSQPIVCSNCDDPHDVGQSLSDVQRKQATDWWDLTMSTRGVSRKVRRAIVMQRLNEGDLAGHILESEKGEWVHICLPMRYEDGRMKTTVIGGFDPRKEEGELLFPGLFDESAVATMESKLGLYGTAGQLQQRPSPLGGGMFKRHFFGFVDVSPVEARRVRSWDKASISSGGAYSCGVKVAEHQGIYYIEDVVRDQLDPFERNVLIKQIAERDYRDHKGSLMTVIEQEPGSGGKESSLISVRELAGYPVMIDRVSTGKVERAYAFASQCGVGNVKIVGKPSDQWVCELLDELESFPNGKYKDQVDCCTGAFNKLALGGGMLPNQSVFGDEDETPLSHEEIEELPSFLKDLMQDDPRDDEWGGRQTYDPQDLAE